jgi:hypothetical protein
MEETMTTEEFKAHWLHYIDVCNKRDIDEAERIINDLMTVDCLFHVPGWPDLQMGISGQNASMREWIEKNPDFHISMDEVMIVGNKMIVRWMLTLNNAETGAVETMAALEIDRVVSGKMAESWALLAPGKW